MRARRGDRPRPTARKGASAEWPECAHVPRTLARERRDSNSSRLGFGLPTAGQTAGYRVSAGNWCVEFELQPRGFGLPIAGLLSRMGESDDILNDISAEYKPSWYSGRLRRNVVTAGSILLPAMMFCHILSIA